MKLRSILTVLLFFMLNPVLSAHNEMQMKKNIVPGSLTEAWSLYENRVQSAGMDESTLEESDEYLEKFILQLESDEISPVREFAEEDRNVIEEIKDLSFKLRDSESAQEKEILVREITRRIIEHQNIEKAESDYKVDQFFRMNVVLIIVLAAFIFATITLALVFNNAKRQEINARRISEQMTSVQESERKRISTELHDTITQDIRTCLLYVRELNDLGKKSSEENYVSMQDEAQSLIEKIENLETQNLINIRNIIRNLTPQEIETADFRKTLSEYCISVFDRSGIKCNFYAESDLDFNRLKKDQRLNVFRIVQESITNSIKHSGASEISVIVRSQKGSKGVGEKFIFFISDNGKGFDVLSRGNSELTEGNKKVDVVNQSTHLGIEGMKNRAKVLNAELRITSDEESGTEVRLVVKC